MFELLIQVINFDKSQPKVITETSDCFRWQFQGEKPSLTSLVEEV